MCLFVGGCGLDGPSLSSHQAMPHHRSIAERVHLRFGGVEPPKFLIDIVPFLNPTLYIHTTLQLSHTANNNNTPLTSWLPTDTSFSAWRTLSWTSLVCMTLFATPQWTTTDVLHLNRLRVCTTYRINWKTTTANTHQR